VCNIIVVPFNMTILIYHIHWIIYFIDIHNKIFYFSSIMQSKWDITLFGYKLIIQLILWVFRIITKYVNNYYKFESNFFINIPKYKHDYYNF